MFGNEDALEPSRIETVSVSTIRQWMAGAERAENVLYNPRLRSA